MYNLGRLDVGKQIRYCVELRKQQEAIGEYYFIVQQGNRQGEDRYSEREGGCLRVYFIIHPPNSITILSL